MAVYMLLENLKISGLSVLDILVDWGLDRVLWVSKSAQWLQCCQQLTELISGEALTEIIQLCRKNMKGRYIERVGLTLFWNEMVGFLFSSMHLGSLVNALLTSIPASDRRKMRSFKRQDVVNDINSFVKFIENEMRALEFIGPAKVILGRTVLSAPYTQLAAEWRRCGVDFGFEKAGFQNPIFIDD